MDKKNKLVLTTLTTAGAALLLVSQTAATRLSPTAVRLEGVWVSKVPGTPLQWTTKFSPIDSSGRHAVLSGSLQVAIPAQVMYPEVVPESDYNTPVYGEIIMTGPRVAKFTTVGYSIKNVVPTEAYPFAQKIAVIWLNFGEVEFTSAARAKTTHHVSYYYPEADANGDGIPDSTAAPFLSFPPTTTVDTRLSLMAPHDKSLPGPAPAPPLERD